MPVHGIDISDHNDPNIDWSRVNDSQKFVFFKINEGDFIAKSTSAARVADARKNGLLVGGYDFVRPKPGRSGAQEFDIFWKRAKAVGLDKKGSLRPVIDIEATGFTGPLAKTRTRRYVKSWVRRCFKVTGHHPIIYTGHFWREQLGNWTDDLGCKLWLASYGVGNSKLPSLAAGASWRKNIPAAWKSASFLQYGEYGRVAGVDGNVDVNVYLSDLGNLKSGHTLK